MLEAAGVPFEVMAAGVDEEAMKEALVAQGTTPRNLADALAELKATKLSRQYPEDLVLGCDQVASLGDRIFDKAKSREECASHLETLSGETHTQTSAAVICEAGKPVWRHTDVAKLDMRKLGGDFIETYLDAEWPEVGYCAGGYRIEGKGAQLFTQIDGSHFTVLGMPLLPLLDYLRVRKVVAT